MSKEFLIPNFDLSKVFDEFFKGASRYDAKKSSKTNLIDPFAAALEASLLNFKSKEEWQYSEYQRTRQKNLTNHLGDLQQNIIGQLPGWKSHKSGTSMPDIVGVRGKQKIICEVKNKHNTMNSASAGETYDVMSKFLSQSRFQNYVGIVVQVIKKTPKNHFWTTFSPDRKERKDILVMNARVFYAFATDPDERIPEINVKPNEDMRKWKSWHALDYMLEEFWSELEKHTQFKTPAWIKALAASNLE